MIIFQSRLAFISPLIHQREYLNSLIKCKSSVKPTRISSEKPSSLFNQKHVRKKCFIKRNILPLPKKSSTEMSVKDARRASAHFIVSRLLRKRRHRNRILQMTQKYWSTLTVLPMKLLTSKKPQSCSQALSPILLVWAKRRPSYCNKLSRTNVSILGQMIVRLP